jgi:hypothetical protein
MFKCIWGLFVNLVWQTCLVSSVYCLCFPFSFYWCVDIQKISEDVRFIA